MIVPVRTLLCVFALVSASSAVVYRPDKGMVYQRRQTVSSAAAKAKSSSPPFKYGNPSQDYDGVVDHDAKGTPQAGHSCKPDVSVAHGNCQQPG